MTHTPLPLQIATALKTLSGDDLKVMVLLCYQTFNADRSQLTLEQIESLGGIPRHALKPSLMRLMRRAWIVQEGPFYRLALAQGDWSQGNWAQGKISGDRPGIQNSELTNYDPALGIRPPRVRANLLYPDGPWLTETGFLDEAFVRDRAAVWQKGDHYQAKSFGAMAIEDVMGLVCKHYAKYENHGNLEIDWQSYCLKNQRYLKNVKTRLDSGAEITPTEQAQVMEKLPLLNQALEPVYAPQASSLELEPTINPEIPSHPSVPATVPAAALPGMVAKRLKLLSQTKAMPDRVRVATREVKTLSRLERLNLWVQDPILRGEAEREAKGAGYAIAYSEAGIPLRVMDVDDCEDF